MIVLLVHVHVSQRKLWHGPWGIKAYVKKFVIIKLRPRKMAVSIN